MTCGKAQASSWRRFDLGKSLNFISVPRARASDRMTRDHALSTLKWSFNIFLLTGLFMFLLEEETVELIF